MEWPRKNGNNVRALRAANKAQHGPRVRVRVRLCRPKVRRHLIGAMLSELPDTQVVIVQYVDDILFVGWDRLPTTQVAHDTAAHLDRKGFLVSPKSVLDATSPSRGWGSKSTCIGPAWRTSLRGWRT